MSKLSWHFHDDATTAIIIRNVKTLQNLIELLDAFDEAGPSNASFDNNSCNLYQNYRSYTNVYGELPFSNKNNSRGRNYVPNANQNNFGATTNKIQIIIIIMGEVLTVKIVEMILLSQIKCLVSKGVTLLLRAILSLNRRTIITGTT